MGVEYSHGLFVLDLMFRPTWDHVVAVEAAMKKWKFVGKDLYDLAEGFAQQLERKAAKAALPANLMVDYGELEGKPVAALMGESSQGVATKERSLSIAMGFFGVDFKVMTWNETFEVELTTPPKDDGEEIEDYDEDSVPHHHSYPSTWKTKPPKTKVLQGTASDRAFKGVWRTGIILDCGQDLPMLAEDNAPLPGGFRAALEQTLGTKLVEVGWYY